MIRSVRGTTRRSPLYGKRFVTLCGMPGVLVLRVPQPVPRTAGTA
jgi:hypothetical protein